MIYDFLYWIFMYIFCTAILPIVLILGNNLFASLCFYTYKIVNKNDPNLIRNPREFWRRPYTLLTKYWLLYGRILHGKISILVTLAISPQGDALLKKSKIKLNACIILLLLLYLARVIFRLT
jgi:hypothetical protein